MLPTGAGHDEHVNSPFAPISTQYTRRGQTCVVEPALQQRVSFRVKVLCPQAPSLTDAELLIARPYITHAPSQMRGGPSNSGTNCVLQN